MKKKIWLSLMLSAAMAVTAACGSSTDTPPAAGGDQNGDHAGNQVTLKIFQFKVEIAEQLTQLAQEYEKENPGVKIQIDTVGGGSDYGAALKARFSSSDTPDIFNNGGNADLELWLEHLEDLSDQPWVKDLASGAGDAMTKDGKIYGQPLNLEGYGYIYNKDLFAQAGITELPRTISELREVAQKLQDNGITPFVNGYAEWWVLGNHFVNLPFAYQEDPDAFIASLNEGSAQIPGNEKFSQWLDLFDLTLEYGNNNPLQTDYKSQVTEFALGHAAMVQQGNWTQLQISETNPDINIGFLPMPISDDAEANDKLPVGVPNNWVINKNSQVKEEAKKFLNWMVTSDTGKRYITEEFKFIPAFTTIEADESLLGPLAADIIRYTSEGKTLSWNWFKFPGGEASSKKFGDAMQSYVAGRTDRVQLLESFQSSWDSLK
ncbi:ABC transporter substrate-binding protein [Paenibacillus senegalensis]|uniref:ABC transporter substrate-binding protein n=1 Tax=Paenibacillus senegalensis TaxID=1465766 RepID=UPI000287F12D|nr:ABC transporter substrate-binding protein [Paenibacillus senegalensis]